MINPFMDTAHTAHLPHGALKLSPPHHMADTSGAAHSQGSQFGSQANGYMSHSAHAHHYAARDFLLRRDHMSLADQPSSHHSMFVPSTASLHGPHSHSDPASSHVIFPGLHDTAHHTGAAHVNGTQMRLSIPGADMYGPRADQFQHQMTSL